MTTALKTISAGDFEQIKRSLAAAKSARNMMQRSVRNVAKFLPGPNVMHKVHVAVYCDYSAAGLLREAGMTVQRKKKCS